MALPWLKYNFGLAERAECLSIAHATGLDRDAVVGKLLRLWQWAQVHTTSGVIKGATAQVVDEVARHEGFAEAMKAAGWLVVDGAQVKFPRWDKHNSKGAKARAVDQARKDAERSKNRPNSVRVDSDENRTRTDKNREDKNNNNTLRLARTADPDEHAQVVVVVREILGGSADAMLAHKHATPERLAWIARTARQKDDPGGWAAACIREGWLIPLPTEEETKERNRDALRARLAKFDALPAPERSRLIAKALGRFPNLIGLPNQDASVRGAVAAVMLDESPEGKRLAQFREHGARPRKSRLAGESQ